MRAPTVKFRDRLGSVSPALPVLCRQSISLARRIPPAQRDRFAALFARRALESLAAVHEPPCRLSAPLSRLKEPLDQDAYALAETIGFAAAGLLS